MPFAALISMLATLFGPAADAECYVLGGLDVARAQALASVDLTELRAVYANPAAASADERILKRFAARGFRVVGAGMVRDECRAVERGQGRVELDVTERLATAWAIGEDGSATRLPRDRFSRHRIVLTAQDGRWRIASVR